MRKEMSIPEIEKIAKKMTNECLNPQIVVNIPEDPWDFITVQCITKCGWCRNCRKTRKEK